MNRSLFFACNLLFGISLWLQAGNCAGAASWSFEKAIEEYPTNEQIKIKRLFSIGGIGENVSNGLYADLKLSAHLSDEQFNDLVKLGNLGTKIRQLASHNYGSAYLNSVLDEKVKFVVKISKTLSEDQMDEYCQWMSEEKIIRKSLDSAVLKKGNDESTINDTVEAVVKSAAYKSYKEKKEMNKSFRKTSKSYFLNRIEKIKARVKHDWLNLKPRTRAPNKQ